MQLSTKCNMSIIDNANILCSTQALHPDQSLWLYKYVNNKHSKINVNYFNSIENKYY